MSISACPTERKSSIGSKGELLSLVHSCTDSFRGCSVGSMAGSVPRSEQRADSSAGGQAPRHHWVQTLPAASGAEGRALNLVWDRRTWRLAEKVRFSRMAEGEQPKRAAQVKGIA